MKVKKGGGIMFQRKRRRRLNEIPEKPLGVKGSKEGNFLMPAARPVHSDS